VPLLDVLADTRTAFFGLWALRGGRVDDPAGLNVGRARRNGSASAARSLS